MTDKNVEKEKDTELTTFTPENISENLIFTIPLYQRIFTWGEKEIKQLLYDLYQAYQSYKKNSNSPYYLGMLTLKYNDESQSYDVIDGQQRLTILMLLGAGLKEKQTNYWNNFLVVNKKTRLSFPSREHDNNFLDKAINSCKEQPNNDQKKDSEQATNSEYDNQEATQCNPNLIFALSTIHSYLNEIFTERNDSNNSDDMRLDFSGFIFSKLTFFVTYLPKSYTPRRLNKYFDRMNDSGKNLEPHEILLGEYLKILDVSKEIKNKITDLWKKATDLSNTMSIVKSELLDITESGNSANKQNVAQNGNIEKKQTLSILELAKIGSTEEPPIDVTEGYSQSLLNINELLLLCLYRVLYKDSNSKIEPNEKFNFNTSNIINTFKSKLSWTDNDNTEKIIKFIQTFFLSRYLLDCYFLRRDESGRYLPPQAFLPQNKEESIKEDVELLMRFEEFLYVVESPESNYRWFNPLLDAFEEIQKNMGCNIKDNQTIIRSINDKLIKIINDKDKEQLKNNESQLLRIEALSFGTVNRYWFWRLDLALWQDRAKQFKPDYILVANNYHFRRNRSIEHVAPQKPKTDSKIKLEENKLDSFGNLCMISSGLNSSLQNESFEVKKAHVESYVKESVGGTIESLKLLAIYQYCENNRSNWNDVAVEKHGEAMLKLLNNSLSKRGSSL